MSHSARWVVEVIDSKRVVPGSKTTEIFFLKREKRLQIPSTVGYLPVAVPTGIFP